MRIAVLVDSLEPGGVQKAAVREVSYLRRTGVQADLVVLKKKRVNAYQNDIDELNPTFLSDFRLAIRMSPSIPLFHYFSAYHLAAAILPTSFRWKKYDLIVSHGSTTTITAFMIHLREGVPYFAFIWDPMAYILRKVYSGKAFSPVFSLLKPIVERVERVLLSHAALVLTCSQVHSTFLEEAYSVKPMVVYPGCDLDSPPIELGDSIVAFTRWEQAKNPRFLLDILHQVPNVGLVMAGEWRSDVERDQFIEDVQARGLEKRVRLLGYYEDKDIPKVLSMGIVWVHPNLEAFGMGALEAASCGCPVMIPRGSGVTELFTEGEHGYFPQSGALQSWVECIRDLTHDRAKAVAMGRAARLTARKYTWKYHSERLQSLIADFRRVRSSRMSASPINQY